MGAKHWSPRALASRATDGVRRLFSHRDPIDRAYGHGPTHYMPSLNSSSATERHTHRSHRTTYADKGPGTSPPRVHGNSPTFFAGRAAQPPKGPAVTPAGPPRVSKNLVRI